MSGDVVAFNTREFIKNSDGFTALYLTPTQISIPPEGLEVYETETRVLDEFNTLHTEHEVGMVKVIGGAPDQIKVVIHTYRKAPTSFVYVPNRERFYVA